ncbi:MAG: hypothetical protein R2733_24125 [Acidimicrobiales bacterium]
MTDNNATIASDQIRISIEIGADYAMSDTLASLLQQVQAEVSDDEVSGFAMDFMNLKPRTGLDYLTITMENVKVAGYTENDSKGKKKGI